MVRPIKPLETANLQLNGHKAVQSTVEEQQVEREVPSPDLHGKFRSDEAEVASELDEELAKPAQQPGMQVRLRVTCRQAQELEYVGILEGVGGIRVCVSALPRLSAASPLPARTARA